MGGGLRRSPSGLLRVWLFASCRFLPHVYIEYAGHRNIWHMHLQFTLLLEDTDVPFANDAGAGTLMVRGLIG